jgi:hypothetical protein
VTVTSADGPRSTVPDPPFRDAAPLLAVTLESMPGGDDGQARLPFLYVDLDGWPGAAAVVRGDRRPGTVLEKALTLFVHSSGNGYVGITVTEHDGYAVGPGGCSGSVPRVLRVAVDPVRHAAGLEAAVRCGRLVMAHHWASAAGDRHRSLLPVEVDRGTLERVVRAALTHPRRVHVALRDGPGRRGA